MAQLPTNSNLPVQFDLHLLDDRNVEYPGFVNHAKISNEALLNITHSEYQHEPNYQPAQVQYHNGPTQTFSQAQQEQPMAHVNMYNNFDNIIFLSTDLNKRGPNFLCFDRISVLGLSKDLCQKDHFIMLLLFALSKCFVQQNSTHTPFIDRIS